MTDITPEAVGNLFDLLDDHMHDPYFELNDIAATLRDQAARIVELEAASAWQLIRYEPARGETMQQARGNFIGGELHEKGDAILVWLNQDDILMHEMNKPLPTQPEKESK